jgi:hypothetical protein
MALHHNNNNTFKSMARGNYMFVKVGCNLHHHSYQPLIHDADVKVENDEFIGYGAQNFHALYHAWPTMS